MPGDSDLMTTISALLGTLAGWPIVAIAAAAVFLETATVVGMLVPSEITLLLAAVAAATGRVSPVWLVVAAAFAAVAGDSTAYAIGRFAGPKFEQSRVGRLVGQRNWARAHLAAERHGGRALLLGRWVGFVRTLLPLLHGSSGMPVRRFLVADAAAAAVWASGVVTIGYLGAGSIHQISSGLTEAGIVVVVAAAVTTYLFRHRRTRLPMAAALPAGDATATPRPAMAVLEAPSRRALCLGRR
jgi:membrane-associated protein